MAPIRILQVMPAMDAGGMETFVMNVYRAIDRDKVQFDFVYHYDKPCFYDYEIRALGGQIYKLTVRQDNNLPRYLHQLDRLFAEHPEYRIVHGHYSGFGMFYNAAARRRGVPVRIGHSHNTAYEPNLVGKLDKLMSARFNRDLTDRFACSRKAGEMLFGASPFTVLPNGVDTGAFARHDPEARARLREHLGVAEDEILLGHVGRFSAQKNHAGLLRIFAAALQRRPNARLLLLGQGPLEAETRALAQEPRVLLLDEPTSSLDPRNQHETMQTVRRIAHEKGICAVVILHDLNLAIRYCDKFLFLKDSEVFAYGGREVMNSENIEEVYRMHVHILEYMGIPVVVPFPDIKL